MAMKIAIIGTGNVGSALAKGWAKTGHRIYLGVRNIHEFKGKNLLSFSPRITVHSTKEAADFSEVILIAAVPGAVKDIVKEMGDVSGKVIIDAMNSIFVKPEGFSNTTSALVSLTNSKDIVKCFNTTGAENMENPIYLGNGIDMFIAGHSKKAKEVATGLASDLGFESVYDFGGEDRFDLMEQFALCWINLAIFQKQGRNIAFKVVKR